jgi:hypothetical protein
MRSVKRRASAARDNPTRVGERVRRRAAGQHHVTRAVGRPVTFQHLPVNDYVAALVSAGLGAEEAVGLANVFDEVLDGRNAHLGYGVKDVLGREPRDFAAFARSTLTTSAHHG